MFATRSRRRRGRARRRPRAARRANASTPTHRSTRSRPVQYAATVYVPTSEQQRQHVALEVARGRGPGAPRRSRPGTRRAARAGGSSTAAPRRGERRTRTRSARGSRSPASAETASTRRARGTRVAMTASITQGFRFRTRPTEPGQPHRERRLLHSTPSRYDGSVAARASTSRPIAAYIPRCTRRDA